MFDLPGRVISVLIEPGATIHAALETSDGRTLAFAGPADMETPVRIACGLDFDGTSRVIDGQEARNAVAAMSEPDAWARRAISLGYAALDAGGTSPMVLAIADEAAVSAYLAGNLRFGDIVPFIESVFERMRWACEMDPESERDLQETLTRASSTI
jgi:1-deoxy-D-xylulose-5-phosphate reductoisomerase